MLKIYVISLKRDVVRRDLLKILFPVSSTKFNYIDAIDGNTESTSAYYKNLCLAVKRNILLSPSEWGCTLSHLNALKSFLLTDSKYALILEDDIVGDDNSIKKIEKMIQNTPNNFFLICGGQDGLVTQKFLYGKEIFENIYELANFSKQYIFRSCCYVVTKDIAQHIVDYHSNGIMVTDSWSDIFNEKKIPFYFSQSLHHPIDLIQSNIEFERKLKSSRKINIFYRFFRYGYRIFMVKYLNLIGYKKL